MSRDARYLVSRLLDIDPKKRLRAQDIIKESWIKCQDLPLSIFETAGGIYRANSVDNRTSLCAFVEGREGDIVEGYQHKENE